jgi:hypothetical protein
LKRLIVRKRIIFSRDSSEKDWNNEILYGFLILRYQKGLVCHGISIKFFRNTKMHKEFWAS